MNSDDNNQKVIHCAADDECRIYCNICDKLCIKRFFENHLKSELLITNFRKNQILIQKQIISINPIQIIMNTYCSLCDETFKLESKNIHLKSFLYIQNKKSRRINQTIKNLAFFDIDRRFNEYITNHNKKFESYLLKCEFKLDFNNLTPHTRTDFYHNPTIINLKRYFFKELIILLKGDINFLI